MQMLATINLVLVIALSLAAGLAKVAKVAAELEFLTGVGLSETQIVAFGLVQLGAGALMIAPKTRFYGAMIAALAFFASTVLIFISGNYIFGLVSIIPVIMADAVILRNRSKSLARREA